ncbi:MAG: hemerythrin domain-containing protein [Elusimicrobia bacterium]|nr:hemerythrin domain-containing protein [Elusimicrobiota bacterium]
MKATEQLMAEHEGILLMLRVLDKLSGQIESGRKVDSKELEKILEFLRVFADKCHHGKEEDVLFPAMEKAGMPRDGGPIAVMLAEHNQGRAFIRGLAEAIGEYGQGDAKAGAGVVENGRGYIALLTQHINKENNILFPMADRLLGEKKQDELAEEFERIEVERIGLGKHEEFHGLLERLETAHLG